MKNRLTKVKKPTQLLKSKKKKTGEMKLKNKMESMSVDAFMNDFINGGLDESKNTTGVKKLSKKSGTNKKKVKLLNKKKPKGKEKHSKNEGVYDDDNDDDDCDAYLNEKEEEIEKDFEEEEETGNDSEQEEEEDEEECETLNEYQSHKKQLKNLKESDPEFYKFLEENDEDLLNFDDSDLESNDEDNEMIHKPPEELEVASDESDYEPDEEVKRKKGQSNKVTKEMVEEWQKKLKTKCKIQDLRDVTEAFHAAVASVSPEEDTSAVYKVEGAVVFNSVIRICVTDFLPALQKTLRYAGSKTSPPQCRNWNRVKGLLRNYLIDLAELSLATSPNMLRVLLKHIHQLCPFIVCYSAISPKFLKRLIQLWATDEDVIRVLAFLCILRLSNLRGSLLRQALKMMHLTYVRNTKFVSPSSLPGINFMRQSLCEMFALDNTISYHMVFLYIRQMAIHLRSAITQKKKESYKIVYNWAYISSLHLWAELFGIVSIDSPLKSLVYPLVQIIIGTIKLIPSSTYYPLRFHCCKILIQMRRKCDVFIPVVSFLLEVLRDFNFGREHKKMTVKPLDFTCLLRCSKSQMKENGFKDAIVENVYDLLMEYLAAESHRMSFPDVTIPCVVELKRFVKSCKFANYSKKMKSIVDKIAENSKFIEGERKKLNLKIDDLKGVEAAEAAIKAKEPPFLRYYNSWMKIHVQQQARKLTNNESLGDFKVPLLNKLDNKRKKKSESEGPTVLFPSDDEDSEGENFMNDDEDEVDDDDDDDDEPPKKKKKTEKGKKSGKKKLKSESFELEDEEPEMNGVSHDGDSDDSEEEEEEEDIVEDLNYSDFKR